MKLSSGTVHGVSAFVELDRLEPLGDESYDDTCKLWFQLGASF